MMDPTESVHKELPARTHYFQYKGVWDMEDLYKFVASFFHRNKFKFYEAKLIRKKPGPFGPETYHYWNAERDVEEYYKYIMNIFIHVFDEQYIEVTTKDGTKKTMSKGRLWIQFRSKVQTDYEKRWEENAFFKNLRNFYHRYVIWKKIEAVWWDHLQYSIHLKLISLVKERLKTESEGFEHRYFNQMR